MAHTQATPTGRSAPAVPIDPAAVGGDPLEGRRAAATAVAAIPLSAVTLLDPALERSQQRDLEYVLSLDPERLAAPYLEQAGLEHGQSYGNWEGEGMGGHIGGHYLSACAQLSTSTGDPVVHRRMTEFVDVLARCAEASRDGFIGGVPGGAALGDELSEGRIDADLFELNGRWVPLYNLHKTLSGLLDAWTYGGSSRALSLACTAADWWCARTEALSDDDFERILTTEFGGMTEFFATLGAVTGRDRYLREARRFLHLAILEPLVEHRDALTGLHANTQIPKVIGYELLGQIEGDPRLLDAAEFFWDHVTSRRTVAFGGNSVREHFHRADDFSSAFLDRQGPESCNTVNMIELSKHLYLRTGEVEYLAFVERALLNHVLASQHPERGGFVYFTPLRPAHYRVYSQPATSMWCCVGSGMEVNARLGEVIFALSPDSFDVNLLVGARGLDPSSRMSVSIETDGTPVHDVTLRLAMPEPVTRTVRVRVPEWASSFEVHAPGGIRVDQQEHWVVLTGRWHDGDAVSIRVAARIRLETPPDGSAWGALVWGPLVLAARADGPAPTGLVSSDARMGHVASGELVPLGDTPVLTSSWQLLSTDGSTGRVSVATSFDPVARQVLELEPFSGLHDVRYTMYWPTGDDPEQRRRQLTELEIASSDIGVIDAVAAGEQQPEADHRFQGEGSRAGGDDALHWRSATGWFSYQLSDPDGMATSLVIRSRDTGPYSDEVGIDGVPTEASSARSVAAGLTDHTYPLPERDGTSRVLTVRITAVDGGATRTVVTVSLQS